MENSNEEASFGEENWEVISGDTLGDAGEQRVKAELEGGDLAGLDVMVSRDGLWPGGHDHPWKLDGVEIVGMAIIGSEVIAGGTRSCLQLNGSSWLDDGSSWLDGSYCWLDDESQCGLDGSHCWLDGCWRSSISVLVLILMLVSTGRGRQIRLASKIPFYLL